MIVPFRRRGSSLGTIIDSKKHIIDIESVLVSAGTTVTIPFVTVTASQSDPFVAGEVPYGSRINGFFISFFALGATGSAIGGSVNWYIIKTHQGQTSLPNPGATGISNLRNQIVHEEKGLAGSGDGTPMAFKGVVVVPKSMRRLREGDGWLLIARLDPKAVTNADICFKAIYKAFT